MVINDIEVVTELTNDCKEKDDSFMIEVRCDAEDSPPNTFYQFNSDFSIRAYGYSRNDVIKELFNNIYKEKEFVNKVLDKIIRDCETKYKVKEFDGKIGMILGEFRPFHSGHKDLIEKAFKHCKTLLIVLLDIERDYDECASLKYSYLSLDKRKKGIEFFVDQLKEYQKRNDTDFMNNQVFVKILSVPKNHRIPLKEFLDDNQVDLGFRPNTVYHADIKGTKYQYPEEFKEIVRFDRNYDISSSDLRRVQLEIERLKKEKYNLEEKSSEMNKEYRFSGII